MDLCSCLWRLNWMYGVNTSKSNGSTKPCSCSSRPFTLADSLSCKYHIEHVIQYITHTHTHTIQVPIRLFKYIHNKTYVQTIWTRLCTYSVRCVYVHITAEVTTHINSIFEQIECNTSYNACCYWIAVAKQLPSTAVPRHYYLL